MEEETTVSWYPSGGAGGNIEDNNVPPGGVLIGGSTTLIKMQTTPENVFRSTPDQRLYGKDLFTDIQVPYIVIIWVVALGSSIFSIALCCLCNYLQKRAQRLRRRRARSEPSQETKHAEKKQNQTPIKIANPLSCRDSCAICCEPYSGSENDAIIGYIRPCGHYFHHACAWRWISARETCPLCRNPVNLRKSEMTAMTLNELEDLLGVPNGTLRRDKQKQKAGPSLAEEGRLKTISLTMNLPVVLQSSEVTGNHGDVVIVHSTS